MVQINTLLDLHPFWVVAGLDIRNAFNTVSCLTMLKECAGPGCRSCSPLCAPLLRPTPAPSSTATTTATKISPRPPARSRGGGPYRGGLFTLA